VAAEVDICNLALAHLGQRANVVSINPPEGSAEAPQCARFYPMARDTLLELHPWRFATRRVALADLSAANPPADPWRFSYALPDEMIRVLAITGPERSHDDEAEPYAVELAADGAPVIYTDMEDAWARYTARVIDTTRFSPLFVETLAYLLASYLAGPVIKGDSGIRVGQSMLQAAMAFLAKAQAADAAQARIGDLRGEDRYLAPWIAGR
jgi:hypothetical protein